MSDYWQGHYDAATLDFDGALLKQVGKTVNGVEVPEGQLALIVGNIISLLVLDKADVLADLCCGNGLITRRLAPFVREVVGIDFSLGLIETAKRTCPLANIEYRHADVTDLPGGFFGRFGKVLMYEALQHFSEAQFGHLLGQLVALAPGAKVLLGSIPDAERLRDYYDTEEKYEFYLQREREGRPHMGRWWHFDEIARSAEPYGFKVQRIPQPQALYTAYYRFDVLLERAA
ncbi:class I SAM-dependent methyltransferase [Sideroxyarcus sp. TK5]